MCSSAVQSLPPRMTPCDQAAAVPSHVQSAAASAAPLAAAPGSRPSDPSCRLVSCFRQHAGKLTLAFFVDCACKSKLREACHVIHRTTSRPHASLVDACSRSDPSSKEIDCLQTVVPVASLIP